MKMVKCVHQSSINLAALKFIDSRFVVNLAV